jgi:hypothetical protein
MGFVALADVVVKGGHKRFGILSENCDDVGMR